jgi:alkanesulfonate monooxygenase SsuD/methylene tetrahydromethanopterin reductase-like flavin-dependent oxidoreductase (luciferase family)
MGLNSVWFTEHHLFDDGYLPQPLTLAAAIAARTERIRLGTAVLLAGLRHPVQLAEEAAIVDIISDGRLDLGVGTGYRPAEFALFGVDEAKRFATVESVTREVVRLWEEVVTPRPVQQPLPLWGGFFGPRGARFAGELGMGLLALDPNLLEPYHAGLLAGGRSADAARMAGVLSIVLSDDPEAVWPKVAPHVAYQIDSYNRHAIAGTDQAAFQPVNPERLRSARPGREPRVVVATPEDAAAYVWRRTSGLPVEEVFIWATIGAMPDDVVDRHLELSVELRDLLDAS